MIKINGLKSISKRNYEAIMRDIRESDMVDRIISNINRTTSLSIVSIPSRARGVREFH